MIGQFETIVKDTPCTCVVTHYERGLPVLIRTDPNDSYPEEDYEFDFYLLNKEGRELVYLQESMSLHDINRLEEEWRHHQELEYEEYTQDFYNEYR